MPFVFVAKLRQKQDNRGKQALCCIVKERILTVACTVTSADIDNCLCCYLCLLFGFCFRRKIGFVLQIQIHIFIHKMQNVVLITPCRIS